MQEVAPSAAKPLRSRPFSGSSHGPPVLRPPAMLTPRRLAPILVAAVLLAALSAPAGAATAAEARKRQEQVRAKRAEAAAQVNALKSSDVELEKAVAVLATQVRSQDAKVAAIRQAVGVAERQVVASEEKITATEIEMQSLQAAVVDRAVVSYMRPAHGSIEGIAGAKSIEDASRRSSMLRQVANSDRDVIDELRATREDLGVEREKAEAARRLAAERREAAKEQLGALKGNLAAKARVEAALDARINEVSAEVVALEKEDAALRETIARETARVAAARAEAAARAAAERASRAAAAARRPVAAPAASAPAEVTRRVSGSGMQWPVNGTVTSEYGSRWGRLHAGIDIGAPNGTPIRAAQSGTVIFAGWQGGYGQAVVIDHGGGLTTLYAHQSRLGTSAGQEVSAGQVIGAVGSTGNSTGNHVHFETRVDGSPQNPRRYL